MNEWIKYLRHYMLYSKGLICIRGSQKIWIYLNVYCWQEKIRKLNCCNLGVSRTGGTIQYVKKNCLNVHISTKKNKQIMKERTIIESVYFCIYYVLCTVCCFPGVKRRQKYTVHCSLLQASAFGVEVLHPFLWACSEPKKLCYLHLSKELYTHEVAWCHNDTGGVRPHLSNLAHQGCRFKYRTQVGL